MEEVLKINGVDYSAHIEVKGIGWSCTVVTIPPKTVTTEDRVCTA